MRPLIDKILAAKTLRSDITKSSQRWLRLALGFTMVELLVAMGLFVILTSITTAGFIQALRSQRALVALMAANDNASLALEQMSREIRLGYNFQTNVSRDALTFVNAYNEIVTYRLRNQAIERGTGNVLSGMTFYPLTSGIARIDSIQFRLAGERSGDGSPPRITINLLVGARGRGLENIAVRIQTTVSARLIDT
jgi:prepilin-type N-terminal cleavage/methylation domain-containing protein